MQALWNGDAASTVVRATVLATIAGANQVIPETYLKTVQGIRPYKDYPCSETLSDTTNADIACALLVAPMWPNQIVYTPSGILSYAMAVIHKRIQTILNGVWCMTKLPKKRAIVFPENGYALTFGTLLST